MAHRAGQKPHAYKPPWQEDCLQEDVLCRPVRMYTQVLLYYAGFHGRSQADKDILCRPVRMHAQVLLNYAGFHGRSQADKDVLCRPVRTHAQALFYYA